MLNAQLVGFDQHFLQVSVNAPIIVFVVYPVRDLDSCHPFVKSFVFHSISSWLFAVGVIFIGLNVAG